MDNLLKQEMDNLKREVSDVGEKFDELSENVKGMADTVNEISFALMGNKFTKDGGIIGKIIQMDAEIKLNYKTLEGRVEALEKKENRNDVYVKILWTVVGAVGMSVLYMVLNIIFKKV